MTKTKINHRDIYHPLRWTGQETLFLTTIQRRMADGGDGAFNFDTEPDYQRGHVWSDRQASQFVGHLIEGGSVPPIVINTDPTYARSDEIVDGKQRLTAVCRWLNGEVPAELTDGRKVNYGDLDEESQRYLTSLSGPTITANYVQLPRSEVLRLYLRLNRGGTIHTDAEIDRVRGLLAEATTKNG